MCDKLSKHKTQSLETQSFCCLPEEVHQGNRGHENKLDVNRQAELDQTWEWIVPEDHMGEGTEYMWNNQCMQCRGFHKSISGTKNLYLPKQDQMTITVPEIHTHAWSSVQHQCLILHGYWLTWLCVSIWPCKWTRCSGMESGQNQAKSELIMNRTNKQGWQWHQYW